jgi:magnesium transporter
MWRIVMADPLFEPEIRMMLEENNEPGMCELCDALHPATLAEALHDAFSVEEIWRILEHTSIANQAAIFEYFPLDSQVQMVAGTGQQHMARLIEQMSHDDRADLISKLDPRVAEGLMRLVDEADRRDIATLVQQKEGTAGAIMTTDYAWLPANITAGEALDRLRLQAPDKETIYYIYVVDEQRRLLGVVSLRDLILKPRHAVLRDFMEEQIVKVQVDSDREKVAQEMARYDLLAIPVVDSEGRLVGIVTYDDAIDVVVSAATEDMQKQAAVGLITENYLEAGFVKVWRQRIVWLAALFIAEMFTFNAMAHFEDELKAVTVLALFVPLCLSTGGNSGSQAATLIIRALSLGHVTLGSWFRALRHELIMGIALGVSLGAIACFRTYFLTHESLLVNPAGPDGVKKITPIVDLTMVVGLAVACICLWGTLIGSMLPLVFKRMGIDPAMASSPFVATFVDVTGITIYLSIARIFLYSFFTGG